MKIELKNNILQLRSISCADTDAVFAYFHIAKKKRYEYYQNNRVSINNRIILRNHELQKQDTVRISLCMEEDTVAPWYEDLEILFEDELFCIVNKPANLLVHSDGIENVHTVYNLVKAHYLMEGHNTCVRALHRLDYETSGALIFCKIPFLQPLLDAMLKSKQIYREYEAFAQGHMAQKQYTITRGIARDRHDARKMRISNQGKAARTDVFVIRDFADFTWIRCRLYTGRTHQIRVHLAAIQHPLLSDPLYGTRDSRCPRLALHACRVLIPHPLSNDMLRVECPLPPDLRQLLD